MITLTNVRKDYGGEVTVGPVDLEIPSAGMTALVGPNGAGKSTLLTMIGRLLGLDDGSIDIAGYDVARTRSKDLARIVSVLRQENHYITRLTVRQLVGFGRFPHSRGRLTAADDEALPDVAETVLTREERGRVRAALARLPHKQAVALVLRHSGLSYAEVAAALDLSPGSVGTTVRRTESALREELNRHASSD